MLQPKHQSLFLSIMQKTTGKRPEIFSSSTLTGGDINQAAKIQTHDGMWFAKWNRADAYPGMFAAEARGLELLSGVGEIAIPMVVGVGEEENLSMLVLEFISSAPHKPGFWRQFGQQLTRLHQHTNTTFGLDHHNYIGSLQQLNQQNTNWIAFFITCRLEEQIRLARNQKRIENNTVKLFERLFLRLDEFFPVEPPSLLHGDLWSGNYMVNNMGDPCIIDPAVYYGHRLMDLGMTRLFGGFPAEFYEAIHETWPLESNWQQATDIANLYPLMVHVNLFGGGYLGSVHATLKRF